jgi:hypothetical protein
VQVEKQYVLEESRLLCGGFLKTAIKLRRRKTFQNTNITLFDQCQLVHKHRELWKETCAKFVSLKASPTLIRRTRVPNYGR